MAKENNINPFLLLGIALFFIIGGWLMKVFPIFLLVGYAPLFALTDRISDKKPFWNQFEFILIALCASIFTAHVFHSEYIIISIVQGIILTLPFIGYGFVRQSLGSRTGKFTIIFFWLAVEYLFLKSPWLQDITYLAEGFGLLSAWMTFTGYTGFLGMSLWILLCNLLAYLTFFPERKINFVFLFLTMTLMAAPFVFSFFNEIEPIIRQDMIDLYLDKTVASTSYLRKGEWMGRTASWVSVLILILSFVRNKTQKK